VNRSAAVLLILLLAGTLACGKYGPPVRAGAEPAAKERKPSFDLPLPSAPTVTPPGAATEPVPPIEQEPPLEGMP
jgi:hypothetical protein